MQAMWDEAFEIVKETEMRARIQGVSAQVKKFDFLFGKQNPAEGKYFSC